MKAIHQKLQPLLTGEDDSDLIDLLVDSIRDKPDMDLNTVEEILYTVWDSATWICSDGFEVLFENSYDMRACRDAYKTVGLRQAVPIFEEVLALIPEELMDLDREEELMEHLQSVSEELEDLAARFFDVTDDLVPAVGDYIRTNRKHLARYFG